MKIAILLACLLAIIVPSEASSSESGSSERWHYIDYPPYPAPMPNYPPYPAPMPNYAPSYYDGNVFENLKRAIAGIIPPARRRK